GTRYVGCGSPTRLRHRAGRVAEIGHARRRGFAAPARVPQADSLPAARGGSRRRRGRRSGGHAMKHALLLVCVLSGTALADVHETWGVEVQPPGKGYKRVTIDNALGNVRIEGHDGAGVIIETNKRAPDEETLDRLRVSLVPDPDGTVRITTHADASPESKPVP